MSQGQSSIFKSKAKNLVIFKSQIFSGLDKNAKKGITIANEDISANPFKIIKIS